MDKIFEDDEELADRVISVIGIPKELLNPEDIVSPEYKIKAEKYIMRKLKAILDEIQDYEVESVKMAGVYYVTYLIAPSMPVRLPQRMENISTKTLLQTIDWLAFADEMLNRCDDLLNDLLLDHDIELTYGTTLIDLSDAAPYPNDLV